MTWALFGAGVPSTIASLWKVEDAATKQLMIELHRNLRDKELGKAEALRRAQVAMLRRYDFQQGTLRGLSVRTTESASQTRFAPPFYWAAFVLVGDGN